MIAWPWSPPTLNVAAYLLGLMVLSLGSVLLVLGLVGLACWHAARRASADSDRSVDNVR